jgi:hypothetical protein
MSFQDCGSDCREEKKDSQPKCKSLCVYESDEFLYINYMLFVHKHTHIHACIHTHIPSMSLTSVFGQIKKNALRYVCMFSWIYVRPDHARHYRFPPMYVCMYMYMYVYVYVCIWKYVTLGPARGMNVFDLYVIMFVRMHIHLYLLACGVLNMRR